MKIQLENEIVDVLKKALFEVDKRSCDPVYKSLSVRIDSTLLNSDYGKSFVLEESEIYSLLEGLSDYQDILEKNNGSDEEKESCADAINDIKEETGLSI